MTAVSQPERLHKDKKPAAREFPPREGQRNTGFLQVLLEAAERTSNEDETKHLRGDGGSTVYRGGGYDRDADGDIVSVFSGNAPGDDRR